MKLMELRLKNFKGIKALELVANGEDLRIFGDNATGKTTIYDSFLWLLFDKDSQNKADFEIKTLDKDGNAIHHLDHEVEGVFEIEGETLTLKKVYREKWTKKRGSAQAEFTGHETDHFIDGVPVRKGEYDAKIKEIAPENLFKLLTSPMYFNEHLHWQDRRRMLLEVCGDIPDEEVIKVNKELKDLPKILGKFDLESKKKIIQARRAEINKELDRIPVRIDEAQRGLPDISGIDEEAVKSALEEVGRQKHEKEAELASLLGGGNQGQIRQQMAEIDAKLLEIENGCRRQHNEQLSEIERQIATGLAKVQELQLVISSKELELKAQKLTAQRTEQLITDLRAKWHEINCRQFEACVDETCPTCGQALPPERIQEAVDKAHSDFNLRKAEDLARVNEEGKAAREKLEAAKATIANLQGEIAQGKEDLAKWQAQNVELTGRLSEVRATAHDYKQQDDYKALLAEKERLQKALEGEEVATVYERHLRQADIDALKAEEARLLERRALLEIYRQGQQRVQELEEQQKELAAEFERLERELYLIELFIRTKASLLTDKINAKFQLARFQLFEEQINGGLQEVCTTTYKGVPWNSLNNGARINVGLDIINTLAEHHGFAPPIFVDNAEAVTELIPVRGQLICLVVSEKDKILRVEGVGKDQSIIYEEAI